MKRYIAAFTILCFLFGVIPYAGITAEASGKGSNISTVGPAELPDSDIFDFEGTAFMRDAYVKWQQEGTPEVMVQEFLAGNIAFVVNNKWCWNLTKRQKMTDVPIWNTDGEMVIPSATANSLFGTAFSGEYVTASQITDNKEEWQSFQDPRGFLIFSHDIDSVIDTSPGDAENIAYREYRSYYDVCCAISKITWNEIEPTKKDWEEARKRVYTAMTLPEGKVGEYEDRYIRELVETIKPYMEAVDLNEETLIPFSDCNLHSSFSRATEMAKLYVILRDKGRNDVNTEELKSKAIDVFNFLADNWIGKNVQMHSNWFFNRITYPMLMAQFMILMQEELDEERIAEVTADLMVRVGSNLVTMYRVPYKYCTNDGSQGVEILSAYRLSSNLLWQTATDYLIYILAENTPRMNDILKYAQPLFDQVRNSADNNVPMVKDGVFEDGSFVFHSYYAYNMGYGYSFIGTLGPLTAVTAGTAFDIQKLNGYSNIYNWIEKSWMPFIYENARIKITAGRENVAGVSGKGNVMVKSLLLLATHSDNKEGRETIERLLKPLVDDYYEEYIKYEYIPIIYYYVHPTVNSEIRPLLDHIKNNVPPQKAEPYNYAYYNMDKFVHKRNDYTFMLSLSSERIDKYEAINSEGYSDWYTGDGMTYLLMDKQQYILDWWDYVDRYSIPGTTVDSGERSSQQSSYAQILPNNSYAGGASDGKIAAAAMQLPSTALGKKSYVEGEKSYFMLDDKIICMGSGITGGEGEVYTTVENYEAREAAPDGVVAERADGYTYVSVDNKPVDYSFDTKRVYENPKYVSLNNDRGWVFFGENNVSVERVLKNKRYAGTGLTVNEKAYDVPFITVKAEHGTDPLNDTYGYVILPNKTEEQLAQYAQKLDFEVLEQSRKRHVIRLYDGTVMANLFEAGTLMDFTFQSPCSVILKPKGQGYKIYLSEPTQKLTTMMIKAPKGGKLAGDAVTVRDNIAYVFVGRDYGATYEMSYIPDDEELLWSATGGDAQSQSGITVNNLSLKIGKAPISTRLYAKSDRGLPISFKVLNEDTLKGKTYIKDERLYYIPSSEFFGEEVVIIEAQNSEGKNAQYKISIETKQ